MRLGGAGRDDANDFFVVFLTECVDNQQNRTGSYGAHGYPPFLIVKGIVALRHSVGIIEDKNSSFKANIVFGEVLAILVLVPCESHSRSRQDSIAVAKRNVNTFVHTSWASAKKSTG